MHERRIVVLPEAVPVLEQERAVDRSTNLRDRREHGIGKDVALGPRIGAPHGLRGTDGMEQEQPVVGEVASHDPHERAVVLVADVLEHAE